MGKVVTIVSNVRGDKQELVKMLKAALGTGWGAVQLESSLTHSLKQPGFNPTTK
jgi:translation initiation factor 1 (eIF-1/SUI1)